MYAWVSKKTPFKPYLAGKKGLGIENGFSGVIEVNGLEAQTEYCYAINLTSEPPSSSEFNAFKTAPLKGQTFSFQFAFGSCFRPTSLGANGRIFKRVLDSHPDLSFMIMLGDQIYADDWKHNGLARVAVDIHDYREVYRHTWANTHLRKFLNHTPVFMTMDDHEVDNDWHWCDAKKTLVEIPFYTQFFRWVLRRPPEERELSYHRVQAGLQAYWEHQGIHAPTPPGRNPASEGHDKSGDASTGPFSYKFDFGAVGFFVMDTRSQRVYSDDQRSVLGEEQWRDLEQWLIGSNEEFRVKFIVTSSSLLSIMLGDFPKDRWSSFPNERDRLLRMISKHGINGVYFLTGDLHSAHAISANLKQDSGQTVKIWEFCSSPFEQATNFLASLITRKHPKHRLWEAYKVHFIVKRNNYGVVTVYFNDPDHPSVHFDLHYQTRKGAWRTKSVSNLQQ
jgi:alkaline phosphatase D